MKERKKYISLSDNLLLLKKQVIDSVPFAGEFVPIYIDEPLDLWYFLKQKSTYKNDPKGTELLQSMQTLYSDSNWHGKYGHGDCDCFTIACLACFAVLGWNNAYVVLAGRTKYKPSHIYCVLFKRGKKYIFDLTNRAPDYERDYKYKQYLKFKI